MKKFMFAVLASVLLIALVVPACAGPAAEENVIKVGVIGPMQNLEGEGHWWGAQKAAKEINDAGGITLNGEQYFIELIQADSNEVFEPAGAAAVMERLITVDEPDFVVGGFRTEGVLGMLEVAMDYHKLFLGCGSSAVDLNMLVAQDYDRYKYFFRVTPFNSIFLVQTDFLILNMIGGMLKDALGMPPQQKLKVAIIAEKLIWADPMVAVAEGKLPAMGMEVVGTWRPSDTATDVTAELSAIAEKEPQIIFTTFSGPVGITYAKQWGELEIPACSSGINVEAQKLDFWESTGGKGNYDTTLNTYALGVATNDTTIPFVNSFYEETGELPTYCVDTYGAIKIVVGHIEKAQTLDNDALIPYMEKTDFIAPGGRLKYYPNDSKYPALPHDIMWGPGLITSLGCQWQDGELKAVWPQDYPGMPEEWEGYTYPGVVPYIIPPRVLEHEWVIEEAAPPEEEAPAEEGALSFEATEYANADYGFSVQYPSAWATQAAEEPMVLYAAAAAQVPAIVVNVVEGADFVAAATAALEGSGSNIEIASPSEVTLADGTAATEAKATLDLNQGFPGDCYVLGAQKGDKWVVVSVTTVDMLVPYDEALFSEIVHTLQFE